jgi:hypothetical protein
MKRIFAGMLAAGVVAAAVAFSSQQRLGQPEVQVQVEDRNPWTHLRFNNNKTDFRFALVSDRTGGLRPGVFERAVRQLNLLQPEFVVSVGDLIQGGTKSKKVINDQWKEFDGFVAQLEMPFFYVPGNHDLSNRIMDKRWRQKFGRRSYHFVYKKVLFLLLNTEDPPGVGDGRLGKKQIAAAKRALQDNPEIRWTIVAMHKPLWTSSKIEKTGWLEMERLLAGRRYTVFAGHKHRYERFVRRGRLYYILGTTGGGSLLRGAPFGEFDHVVWVTMKKHGPVLANLMLEGIFPENLRR